jgi:O-antigen ligase
VPRLLFYLGTATVTESSLRPAFGLSASEILFMAALVGCLFAAMRGHGLPSLPPSLVLGVALFALGGSLSTLTAHSPGGSAAQVLHAIYVLLLWTWTGAMVLRTRQHLYVAIALWSASAAVNGVAAISQVVHTHQRAKGFTDHPNDLGGAAAVALIPALMLATTPTLMRRPAIRWAHWVAVALIAVAVFVSGSVAAMVAGLVATVIWLSSPAVRAPSRAAACAAVAGAISVALVAGGTVVSPVHRVDQVTGPTNVQAGSGSGETRVQMWGTAWSRIKSSPIVGTGFDSAGTAVTVSVDGQWTAEALHGAPIAVWYEGGILSLLGFLVIVGAFGAAGWRGMAAASPGPDSVMGWALFAAFVGWMVFAVSGPFYFQQYGWISGVMLVAWRLRRAARTERSVEPYIPAVPYTGGLAATGYG